jgi:VIT1/CCC1 family predicted Fe2+/Mn2+ transporter
MNTAKVKRLPKKQILHLQKSEITGHTVYTMLSRSTKDKNSKEILERISSDEFMHYTRWKEYTGVDTKPYRFKVIFYNLLIKLLGHTFALKTMTRVERREQTAYSRISKTVETAVKVFKEEHRHENDLISLIDDDRLQHTSEMVRGFNIAVVEMTGALAGFSFALGSTEVIILAGIITGVAITLSVASTEYLAAKSEGGQRTPFRSAVYSGIANITAVIFLILPFFVFTNVHISVAFVIINAIIIIAGFNYYISVAKDVSFRSRFLEMVLISLGVAGLAFVIGLIARSYLNIEL